MVGQHGQIFEQVYKNKNFQSLFGYVLSNNLLNYHGVFDIVKGRYIQDFMSYYGGISNIVPANGHFMAFGRSTVADFAPCPTYSLKRIGDDEVEITNTRTDVKTDDFEGTIAIVALDSDRPFPDLMRIDQRIPIEKLSGGKKTTIKLDFSKHQNADGATQKFGLFVESNGLLDNAKTFPAKTSDVAFDGIFGMNQESTFTLVKWDELR